MKFKKFYRSFQSLLDSCPEQTLDQNERYVIFSDLHMGNGGPQDDLAPNRSLVEGALKRYYLQNRYHLILNGDVEDLNKFKLSEIIAAWPELYGIFNSFAQMGRFWKIVGNHDLYLLKEKEYPYPLYHGLLLKKEAQRLFIFHGHQASGFFNEFDYISEFLVRFLAKPLRIRNSSVSKNSKRRFATERYIYRAARKMGLIAITGHTHRPLFESLSKYDSLRWSIEDLLREYAIADSTERLRIVELVDIYRTELERIAKKRKRRTVSKSLYDEGPLLVPCLFNSGCATGKHGITTIEIDRGNISLVHWATEGLIRPYIEKEAQFKDSIDGDLFRYTLHSEYLDQVFLRLSLLGGGEIGSSEN
jgi:UDP-2,3-diacylglucosamine pyrophosphatase LpxH